MSPLIHNVVPVWPPGGGPLIPALEGLRNASVDANGISAIANITTTVESDNWVLIVDDVLLVSLELWIGPWIATAWLWPLRDVKSSADTGSGPHHRRCTHHPPVHVVSRGPRTSGHDPDEIGPIPRRVRLYARSDGDNWRVPRSVR